MAIRSIEVSNITLSQPEEVTFTKGYVPGRKPQDADFYAPSYFSGAKHKQGIQFPVNGAFLNPESEYRYKFQDILSWISAYVKEGTVLDVGAGPGHLAYWSKKMEKPLRVIGCDISLSLLQSEYNQNRGQSLSSNPYELPFADGKFQAVLFSDILEHIWPHQAVQSIKEAHRLLGEHGYVFVNIPNRITWSSAAQKDQGHVWLPSIKEAEHLLVLGGFGKNGIKTFSRGFPVSSTFREVTGNDLKLPLFGRSIFTCAKK